MKPTRAFKFLRDNRLRSPSTSGRQGGDPAVSCFLVNKFRSSKKRFLGLGQPPRLCNEQNAARHGRKPRAVRRGRPVCRFVVRLSITGRLAPCRYYRTACAVPLRIIYPSYALNPEMSRAPGATDRWPNFQPSLKVNQRFRICRKMFQ